MAGVRSTGYHVVQAFQLAVSKLRSGLGHVDGGQADRRRTMSLSSLHALKEFLGCRSWGPPGSRLACDPGFEKERVPGMPSYSIKYSRSISASETC